MINCTKNDQDVVPLIHMMFEMTFDIFEKICIKCNNCPLNEAHLNNLQNFLSVENLQVGGKNLFKFPTKILWYLSANVTPKCLSVL